MKSKLWHMLDRQLWQVSTSHGFPSMSNNHIQTITFKQSHSNNYIQTITFKQLHSNNHIQTITFKQSHSNNHIQTITFKQLHSNNHIQTITFKQSHSYNNNKSCKASAYEFERFFAADEMQFSIYGGRNDTNDTNESIQSSRKTEAQKIQKLQHKRKFYWKLLTVNWSVTLFFCDVCDILLQNLF